MKIAKSQAIVTNVSRRNLLKGMVGTGGLVLAAQFVPIQRRNGSVQDRRGRNDGRCRVGSACVRRPSLRTAS